MRYGKLLILTLSFLNLYQCSEILNETDPYSWSPSKLELFSDLLFEIARYLELPHRHLSRVNKSLNKVFKEEITYKVFVSRQLNIPEISKINGDNIIELMSIGGLVHFNDSVQVFKALRHGIISLKDNPDMSVPLVKYLHRIYKKADNEQEKLKLDPMGSFVDDLSEFLIEKGHFDLVIEFQMEKPLNILNRLLSFDRIKSFLIRAVTNEIIKCFYIDCLMKIRADLFIKVVHFNLILAVKTPEMIDLTVNILKNRINNNPESTSLIEFQTVFELFIEYREIPISSEIFNNFIKPKIFNRILLIDLIFMSSLADKRDLVLELGREPELLPLFMDLLQFYRTEEMELEMEMSKIENVKLFLDYFLYFLSFNDILIFKIELFNILSRFYYFKSIKYENGTLSIVFEASDELIENLRFPKEVKFEHFTDLNYFNLISNIWNEMKVRDLTAFKQFFKEYLSLPNIIHNANIIFTGSKVIQLFAQDEELIGLVESAGIKLILCNDNEGSLLLQDPPVAGLNRVIMVANELELLTRARKDQELRIVEEIVGKDVSQIILDHYLYEDLMELTEDDYFELRNSLKYWAKSQDSMVYNIRRMESSIVLDLLARDLI